MWIVAILALLGIGFSVKLIVDDVKRKQFQKTAEEEFIEVHSDIVKRQQEQERTLRDEFVPLKFAREHVEDLLKLCGKPDKKWSAEGMLYALDQWKSKDFKPMVDIQYVSFRRVKPAPRPIRIAMVRCTEKYALIANNDGNSGYALKRGALDPEIEGGDMFNIYTEFKPKGGAKPPHEEKKPEGGAHVEPSQEDVSRPRMVQSTESDEPVEPPPPYNREVPAEAGAQNGLYPPIDEINEQSNGVKENGAQESKIAKNNGEE